VRCFLANLNRFPWQIVAQSLSGTKREAYFQTFFTRKVLANLKGIFVKNEGKPEIEKSRERTFQMKLASISRNLKSCLIRSFGLLKKTYWQT
jgi:hypothetical protein